MSVAFPSSARSASALVDRARADSTEVAGDLHRPREAPTVAAAGPALGGGGRVADLPLARLAFALRVFELPTDRGRFDDLLEELAKLPGSRR